MTKESQVCAVTVLEATAEAGNSVRGGTPAQLMQCTPNNISSLARKQTLGTVQATCCWGLANPSVSASAVADY